MTRVLDLLTRKAGAGQLVVAITADHGMPPEPPPGRRHYPDEIVALIDARFDPAEKKIVQYYGDAGNSQMYVDTARLRTLGVTLHDITALLQAQDFVAAAFTEDEVQAAQSHLPSIR